MDILLVAAELAPYVVETAAADTIASLAKSLRLLGHEVTVAMPRYPAFEEKGIMAARRLKPLRLASGSEVVLLDASLPSGVKLVLFDAPRLFDRHGVYAEQGEDFADNPKRFGFFSDCVAALVHARSEQGRTFDVVHMHDYGAGLSSVKLVSSPGPAVPMVLTVHDGELAGTFPTQAKEDLGIPDEFCHQDAFRSGNRLSVLKGAASVVDRVVTTSPSYAAHLATPERTGALSRTFRDGEGGCVGVLGGVDYSLYNPATDSALVSRFDAEDISNKGRNKTAALKELELELELSRPLLVAEAVAGGKSALDTLAGALRGLLKNDLSLVVLADDEHLERLQVAAAPFAGDVRVLRSAPDRTRRRLLAAADFYLGLERRNPSAQALLQAQRYGAVPVAFATEAAADVVVDVDAALETGTGVLFTSMTQRGLTAAVARALAVYASPEFPKLVRRVARQDLGWDRPARRYAQIYRQALAAHG